MGELPEKTANPELPTVSAVIPAYNAADTIERALNSVYAQTYENIIEVIVVDDGSTDDTAQIVRDKFPDVILIQQENGGNAAARNTGIAAATGEYLAFLDADDEWLPEKTEVQVGVMEDLPGAAICLCKQIHVMPNGDIVARGTRGGGVRQYVFRDWLGMGQAAWGESYDGCVSAWLCRATCLEAVGGFDPRLRQCVDTEMLTRMTGLGYVVIGSPQRHFRRYLQTKSVSQGAAAELRKAFLWYRILQRYSPGRGCWRGRLLSEYEFMSLCRERLRTMGYALIYDGNYHSGVRALRKARRTGGGSHFQRMKTAMGIACPAVLRLYGSTFLQRSRASLVRSFHHCTRDGRADR